MNKRAKSRTRNHRAKCPLGWLTIRQYAERYGMSPCRVQTIIHACIVKSQKYKGIWIVEDAPPPEKINGRYIKRKENDNQAVDINSGADDVLHNSDLGAGSKASNATDLERQAPENLSTNKKDLPGRPLVLHQE